MAPSDFICWRYIFFSNCRPHISPKCPDRRVAFRTLFYSMALGSGGKQVGGNFDSGWIRGVRIWKPSGNRVCVEWKRFLSAWPSSSTLFRALFRYSPTKGITKEKREEEWRGSCTADEKYGKAERGKGKQKKRLCELSLQGAKLGCLHFVWSFPYLHFWPETRSSWSPSLASHSGRLSTRPVTHPPPPSVVRCSQGREGSLVRTRPPL